MKLKDTIYEILLGETVEELIQNGVKMQVESLYQDGSECDKLYEAVYNANRAICDKLGVDECKEVETIIANLNDIQRIVAMKMYDYGCQSANI